MCGAPEIVAGGGFEHSWQILDHDNFFNPDNATLDDKKYQINAGPDYYLTTDTTDHALNFLRDHHQQHGSDPFLLYLAYTAPHFPLMAPVEDIARCKGRYDVGWDVIQAQRHQRQLNMKIVDCALAPLPSDTVINKRGKEANPGEVGQAVLWTSLTPEQQRFQAQKMEIHAAMIERMDREIGRVLAHLATIGATDNTLIMFVSDNGASAEEIVRGGGNAADAPPGSAGSFLCLGPGWASAANSPFRLYKKYVHEGGTSSPAIVSWPAGIAARGELRHAASHFIDVVPTLLEVAGAPLEAKKGAPPLPGRSLVQAFAKDGQLTPEPIFFLHQGNAALRIGEMKLVRIGTKGAWELYNLNQDRCEQINLAKKQPERLTEMVKEWERQEALFTEQAGPASKDKKKGKGDE